jgi:hypothetical protein
MMAVRVHPSSAFPDAPIAKARIAAVFGPADAGKRASFHGSVSGFATSGLRSIERDAPSSPLTPVMDL